MTRTASSSTAESSRSRGVLLIGHGTRDSQGTQQFLQLADRLAESVSPIPSQAALLEFQKPTIPDAWESLVSQGVKHIHVAPLLLFAAGHARQDIPEAIERCRQSTPGVTFDQSLPLSRHRAIVDLVVKRVQRTIDQSPRSDNTALVMVGRGNRDPCAQADMRVLSEMVDHRIGAASTRTAFYAMAIPKFPDVLREVAGGGRYDCVVIHPHLLFEGRLHQAIIEQAEQVATEFPNVAFRISPYLGPVEEIARALTDRVDQAVKKIGSLPGNING